jgi:hypothetical protein
MSLLAMSVPRCSAASGTGEIFRAGFRLVQLFWRTPDLGTIVGGTEVRTHAGAPDLALEEHAGPDQESQYRA